MKKKLISKNKPKLHIVASEIADAKGTWHPKVKDFAFDAEKVIKKLMQKHKGNLSLDAMESILHTQSSFQCMYERAMGAVM